MNPNEDLSMDMWRKRDACCPAYILTPTGSPHTFSDKQVVCQCFSKLIKGSVTATQISDTCFLTFLLHLW